MNQAAESLGFDWFPKSFGEANVLSDIYNFTLWFLRSKEMICSGYLLVTSIQGVNEQKTSPFL